MNVLVFKKQNDAISCYSFFCVVRTVANHRRLETQINFVVIFQCKVIAKFDNLSS